MNKNLKILQLAPRFPFPEDDGGKIGIANIFKEFSKQGCDVTLFTYIDSPLNENLISQAENFGKLITFHHSIKNTPSRISLSLIRNKSLYISKYSSLKILEKLDEIVSNNQFDVVHADHTCMAPHALYVKNKLHIPAGLRLHNIEWLIWRRYADTLKSWNPKKHIIHNQSELLRKAESELISRMDVCFAITEEDKKRALKLCSEAKIVVASAGINPGDWFSNPEIHKNPSELILATTFQWIHNVNAVKWLIKEVLPIVKKEVPDIKLTLIGKDAPEWIKNYKAHGVNLLGYVDKVQPYFNGAWVFVAPLFVGGGIRIKILEAMAIGLPVVATSISAEGINAGENEGLFIANNEIEFSDIIIKLCKNPSFAKESGISANKYVTTNFSWKKNVNIMINEYKKMINW